MRTTASPDVPATIHATELNAASIATPRPSATATSSIFPASRQAVLKNYFAAVSLLLIGYWVYSTHPYYGEYFSAEGFAALRYSFIAYVVLLPVYYATFPDSYTVKSRLFWQAVGTLGERPLSKQEKVAVRAVLVKAFFLPLMINFLFPQLGGMIEHGRQFFATGNWFPDAYGMLYRLIFTIDVLIFTIGYMVEHPRLGNEIRSVEPTLLGWVAALACYPPFFFTTHKLFGWYSSETPVLPNPWLNALSAVSVLLLVGIYCWASVALGLKASNLTHRGIVESGPYAYVRHPAYIAKNLSWWIGAIPLLLAHISQPLVILYAIASLAAWSALYGLRAYTEEWHLGKDDAYQEYCRKVPWRFVPGVW